MFALLGSILGVTAMEASEVVFAVGSVMIVAQPVVDRIKSALKEK